MNLQPRVPGIQVHVCQPLPGHLKYYWCLIIVMDGVSEQVTASGWEGMGRDGMR